MGGSELEQSTRLVGTATRYKGAGVLIHGKGLFRLWVCGGELEWGECLEVRLVVVVVF